jgi:hypothetical protein
MSTPASATRTATRNATRTAPAPAASATPLTGLEADEARRRLAEHGANEISDQESHGLLSTLRGIAT